MFDSPFFQKFPQQPSCFIDDQGIEKRYVFPSFYEGSRGMTGFFSCSLSKAALALPSPRLLPVPAGFGKALLVVGAFEYNNPQGMDPYREILFGLAVAQLKPGSLIPKPGLFIKRLIVDVPENVQRGKHLWGMDKSMGEFKFFDEDEMRVCEVSRNGRPALKLSLPRTGRSRRFEECNTLVTLKDGKVLRSRSCMSGRKITAHCRGHIKLGADPFAVELDALGISLAPLWSRYLPNADIAMCLPSESMGL